MTWMFTNRHLKHKFARRFITLQEYTYHIRHRPGALNLLTDALSRHPTCECSQSRRGDSWIWILFAQEDVSKAEHDDPDLATMIGVLSKSSGNRNFGFRDGILYRRVWSKSRNEKQGWQTRLAPYVVTHKVEEADWDRHCSPLLTRPTRPSYLPREKPCANSFTGNFRSSTSRPVWTLPSKSADLSIGRWRATISEQKHRGTLSMRRGPRRNTTIADIDAHRSMVSVTRYECNEGLKQPARSSYLSLMGHLSSRSA